MKSDALEHVAIIGAGSWATALLSLLSRHTRQVHWFTAEPGLQNKLQANPGASPYLEGYSLGDATVTVCATAAEAIQQAEGILICVPSAFLVAHLGGVSRNAFQGKTILLATKGLVGERAQVPSEWLSSHYNLSQTSVLGLFGPSHAEEVARQQTTFLALCGNQHGAAAWQAVLTAGFMHFRSYPSLWAAEWAGALKNVYAIGAGLATGLGYGDNFKAVYAAAASLEQLRWLDEQTPDHLYEGLPLLPDLLVTLFSPHSRNFRFGKLFIETGGFSAARTALAPQQAEGVAVLESLRHNQKKLPPLANTLYNILLADEPAADSFQQLENQLFS